MLKHCGKCNKDLDISCFTRNPRAFDGLQLPCKSCKIEYDRAYRAKNKQKLAAQIKTWQKDNPIKSKVYNANRKVQTKADSIGYTIEQWNALVERYGGRCCGCKKTGVKLTVDHIKPLSKGGTNTIDNIQPLCLSCNSSKGDEEIDYRYMD